MPNTIKIKRGLEANRSSVTPAEGEFLYTTDTKKVFIGDGSTAGGNSFGDVVGPASATDNGLVLYNGTTGKLVKSGLANGTSGQVLTSNGSGSAPSWQSPAAPTGTINATFTAVGAITAGQVVQYTTGSNVQAVTGTVNSTSFNTLSDTAPFVPRQMAVSEDQTKVVILSDSHPYQVAVGTYNSTTQTFTWGTATTITTAGTYNNRIDGQIKFLPGSNTKFGIFANDRSSLSNIYTVWIGDISGNTFTITRNTLAGGTASLVVTGAFLSSTSCIIAYATSSAVGQVLTYSGQTITAGSTWTTISTSVSDDFCLAINPFNSNMGIISFTDVSDDFSMAAFSISGTTITAGSRFTPITGTLYRTSIAFDRLTNGRFFATVTDSGSVYLYCGSVSGTTISGGGSTSSPYPRPEGDNIAQYVSVNVSTGLYDSPGQTLIPISYVTYSSSGGLDRFYIRVLSAADGSTNPTFISRLSDQAVTASSVGKTGESSLANSLLAFSSRFFIIPTYIVQTNLVGANVIGISSQTVANGEAVTVDILGGVNKNQSGLTIGQIYYVSITGALTTTSTAPNVKIGKAITATTLQLKAQTI